MKHVFMVSKICIIATSLKQYENLTALKPTVAI